MRPDTTRGARTAALGRWGEDLAAEHLAADGMHVLVRNWRCKEGELDAVALDADGTVVFVEVKTRAGSGFGEPAEAVGRDKARRLRTLACRWLLQHRPRGATELRFDVIAILRRPGLPPDVTHVRGAF